MSAWTFDELLTLALLLAHEASLTRTMCLPVPATMEPGYATELGAPEPPPIILRARQALASETPDPTWSRTELQLWQVSQSKKQAARGREPRAAA